MLTGRLPCNSVAELDVMIDKIIAVETPQAGQDWRRRGIFVADDEWSNGYGRSVQAQPGPTVTVKRTSSSSERDTLAPNGPTPRPVSSWCAEERCWIRSSP